MKTEKFVRVEKLTPCVPYWTTDEFGNSILMKVKVEYIIRRKH